MRTQAIVQNLAAGMLAAALAVGALVAPAHSAEMEPVTLPGSGDLTDLLRELVVHYEAQYPGRKVTVPNSIGSDGGVRVVGTGEAPIGRVARKPTPEELAKYGEFKYLEFARVPVAFVVSRQAGVKNLTEAQICDIYSGKASNWRDVGGNDLPIAVQARPEDGSNARTIRANMACFTKLEVTPAAHMNVRNPDLVDSMKKLSGAIGFMPMSEADMHGFQIVTIDGLAPTSPKYKLGIGLGFVYKADFTPGIKAFLDFLKSDIARAVMRKSGHVPIEG